MDNIEALNVRKSIRGYKPDMVPKEVLMEMLKVAGRAPSATNTQPWHITVVSGEMLDRIKHRNMELLASGVAPHPDIPYKSYTGVYRRRQIELAIQLFQLMGIERGDSDRRAEWNTRGFRFFDAPAAIIISSDRSMEESISQLDIGIITQSICLAALGYGLGTCISGQGVMFPEALREFVSIPESRRISISIAIGYPDWDFPANKLESKREPVENITTWVGFD